MFTFIELETILYDFRERYISEKLKNKNKPLQQKLEKSTKRERKNSSIKRK